MVGGCGSGCCVWCVVVVVVVVVVMEEYSQMCLSTLGNRHASTTEMSPTALHPRGVGLCNLTFSQFPWVRLRGTARPQNLRSPLPARGAAASRGTSAFRRLGGWLLPGIGSGALAGVCLVGGSYPLPFTFSKISKAGNILRTPQTSHRRVNSSGRNQNSNTSEVRQPPVGFLW